MSNKRIKSTGVTSCTCDLCGIKMLSIKGKYHRRCGGGMNAAVRPKHAPNSGQRGRWT